MIQLPNNCSCSGTPANPKKGTSAILNVYPKNWDKANASIKKDWYVHYYFRDPLYKDKYPKGKYIVAKNGVNLLKTLEERQESIKVIMSNHLTMLLDEGYNPITDKSIPPFKEDEFTYEIPPETPFIEALQQAKSKLIVSEDHLANVKSALKYFSQAATMLKYDRIEIQHVQRKHIRFTFEHCSKIKTTWTDATYNRYRKDISSLFGVLIKCETIEHNPVEKLEKRIVDLQPRITLTAEERKRLNIELRASNYRLWRLMHVFFHSGSRRAEMVRLQRKNINLEKQEFRILNKKGNRERWTVKPIKDVVLPLWREIIQEADNMPNASQDDYIFSAGLKPANKPFRPEQITRRWRLWVKKKLGITADFYSLKHSNTDELADLLGIEFAASLNNHTVAIAKKHYALGEDQRNREKVKKVKNVFA